MPKTRGPCKVGDYFDGERCDMKEVSRGLCARHYEKARKLGKIEMKGTGPKGGRPTGPKLATPLSEEWLSGPDPSVAELHEVVRKLCYTILTDPGASQMERVQFAKIAAAMEDSEGDAAAREGLKNLIAEARGLKVVRDE